MGLIHIGFSICVILFSIAYKVIDILIALDRPGANKNVEL